MKIVLVFVSTLDGKVTKWGDPHVKTWSSLKDQDYFNNLWKDSRLIVMGSNTFNAEAFKPSLNHRLIIMTGSPDNYRNNAVPGQLEFTNITPVHLASELQKDGNEQMLLVGGAHLATSFLKENLVDEIWLTIEPKIFGMGGNFVTGEKLDINLRLMDIKKVNEQGTLITKYEVIKN